MGQRCKQNGKSGRLRGKVMAVEGAKIFRASLLRLKASPYFFLYTTPGV